MLLTFGPIKLETKGMPSIFSVNVYRESNGLVEVSVLLDSERPEAVRKWAKRLGVQAVERNRDGLRVGTRMVEAVLDAPGYRVRVWTTFILDAAEPAATAQAPDADPNPPVLHWPSPGLSTTTSCQGAPLTAESFADNETGVTCPGCRALLPIFGGSR